MQPQRLTASVNRALITMALAAASATAMANKDLDFMSQDDRNWVMQTKDYSATHFSKLDDINASNVKDLKVAWTFSTGTLHGHEGAPLVANGIMYCAHPIPQ